MHELHDDIENYLSLEKDEVNIEFWTVSDVSLQPFPTHPLSEHDGSLQGPLGQDKV